MREIKLYTYDVIPEDVRLYFAPDDTTVVLSAVEIFTHTGEPTVESITPTEFRLRQYDATVENPWLYEDTNELARILSTDIILYYFAAEEEAGEYFGTLMRWTGGAWVKEPLKVYLTGSFQSKPLKRWTGSEWKLVDATGV